MSTPIAPQKTRSEPQSADSTVRSRILSTSSFKTLLSSVSSSGASTPRNMEKTDSVTNLTRSSLYGIFNDNSSLNLSRDFDDVQNGIYLETKNSSGKPNSGINLQPLSHSTSLNNSREAKSPSFAIKLVKLVSKLVVITVSAYLYNEITDHIHNNHSEGNDLMMEPILFTQYFLRNFIINLRPLGHLMTFKQDTSFFVFNQTLALLIQGLIMSLIHPIMDYLLPAEFTKRLLSSNPDPNKNKNANLLNDLIRLLITFLGISYAIRKIEWTSTLQISMIWSLLNPGLWLLLDGTASGFISSLGGATGACVLVYLQNFQIFELTNLTSEENIIAIWLWIGSFFFCGLIIFGKLGRALFAF